ncbi:MAG: hypothetical protein RL720_226 [Actinomycetota bacterium]|jgi:hypothetical protein
MVTKEAAEHFNKAMAQLSEEERALIEQCAEDSSYVTPRVVSHLDEKQNLS